MKKQVGNKLRGSAGFTLVELVVVIAIIGILAGIGTVGYSGYIKRTNEGLDETLYKNIIYAGEIGKYQNPGVTGRVLVSKTGADVESVGGEGAGSDGYNEGNMKVINQWMENAFGKNWYETVKYRTDKYANSSYATIILPAMEITLDDTHKDLLKDFRKSNLDGREVDLANICNGISNEFSKWLTSVGSSFLAQLIPSNKMEEILHKLNVKSVEDLKSADDTKRTQFANEMVLYVAEEAQGMNTQVNLSGYLNVLKGDGKGPQSPLLLANPDGKGMKAPNLALALGVTAGYANSNHASPEIKKAYADATADGEVNYEKLLEIMGSMTGKEEKANYQEYLKDTEKGATADMKAYLSALQVINDSNKGTYDFTFDTSSKNAFNNDQTLALLQGVLNSGK